MKKLLMGLVAICIQFSANAESDKKEIVIQLMEASNVDAMVDAMYSQLDQMYLGIGKQMGVKETEQELFNSFVSKAATIMREEMSWEKMKGPMIEIYMSNYSEKEIQDMLAFYQSETGRSMVEKMPAVMAQSMQLSQQMMKGFIPRLQSLSKEFQLELETARSE